MTKLQLMNMISGYKNGFVSFEAIETAVEAYSSANNNGKLLVSGALPDTKARSCSNCQHHVDKWPFNSECSLHGKLANITHAAEQCCDDWRQ